MPAKQKPAKPVTVVFVIENNASYPAFGVSKMLSGAYLQSRYTYHTSIRSYDVYITIKSFGLVGVTCPVATTYSYFHFL